MVIEIRATLASLVLAAIEDLPGGQADSVALADSDPVEPEKEEETSQAKAPNNGQPAENDGMHGGQPAQNEIFPATGDADDDGADRHLFGTLWPLADAVRLDTSVSRAVFRQQKERMKALGYAFQTSGQLWVRA
jgi:hypothetical protein